MRRVRFGWPNKIENRRKGKEVIQITRHAVSI